MSDGDPVPPKTANLAHRGSLRPWGSQPTPLLPQWYREKLSHMPLPGRIRELNPAVGLVGELAKFWEGASGSVDEVALKSLVDSVRNVFPPEHLIVLPAATSRLELMDFPLRERTNNTLLRAGVQHGYGALSVGDLLVVRNFGIASLLELMCLAECAGRCAACDRPTHPPLGGERLAPEPADPAAEESRPWDRATELIGPLLDAAAEFHGAVTVGDALRLNLHGLASQIQIEPELAALPIRQLTEGRRIANAVTEGLASFRESMSPREHVLMDVRLFRSDPTTLTTLARPFGISRERLRQIQERLKHKLDARVGRELDILADVVRSQLGCITTVKELDRAIARALPSHPEKESSVGLARRMLRSRIDYARIHGLCLDETAAAVVKNLRGAAAELVDDVGLIDESALRDRLPSEAWHGVFSQLMEACGLPRIQGRPVLRATITARTKVAILDIGRPADKREIATAAKLHTRQVGGALARLESVGKADKSRWGLKEWIEEEYEGLPAMIIRRVREHGGATSLRELAEELPRKFKVSKDSVYTTVQAPRFRVRDGFVSLADTSCIRLKRLSDVIHGRTGSGDPYWTFRVEDRYLRGYSLTGLPPEIACELGVEPDGSARVAVVHPMDCGPLSVRWRLTSVSGGSLGYLARPLARLGVTGGDYVRLVIRGSGTVELHGGRRDLSPRQDGEPPEDIQ